MNTQLPIHYAELERVYAKTLGHNTKSIAITAAEPGEGTTTLAIALARRNEVAGCKTLLVDLNLFRPSIHSVFNTPRLEWEPNQMSETKAITTIGNGNLSILTAPLGDRSVVMLREQKVVHAAIKRWLELYETVIVDTSPLNAINQGNIPAELICSQCEGALLVVKAGNSHEGDINSAMERLNGSDTKLLGGIINDMNNPSLVNELCRETYRLQRLFPNSMEKLRLFFQHSAFLNTDV
jgi:protein-tyrosine kinase